MHTLLNDGESSKKLGGESKILELSDNENTPHQNLWDTIAVLRGKLKTAVDACI